MYLTIGNKPRFYIIIIIVLLFNCYPVRINKKTITFKNDCITGEEYRLYKMINDYRTRLGLNKIPLSKSLSYVARVHVRDLADNLGYLTHGWSSCKYDGGNSSTYPCMWKKPKELTGYSGYGFECAHGGSGGYVASATSALRSWQGSAPHNAVITNKGIWKSSKWKALGVGIYRGYSAIWFGTVKDRHKARVCN
ncbi:CAP domain-containing protein [Spirochaetota bacterium]